jgi:Na+/melibiose symporter-like transporter
MCTFVLLAVAFIVTQRRVSNPMLDFRLLRNAALALGGMASITLFICLSASRFLTPFYLQAIKGFDPSRVGLLMLPAAAVTVVVAPLAGRLADRFGVRLFANIGFAIAIVGLGIYSVVQTSSPTWVIVTGLMTLALGMSFFNASNTAAILNSVTSESYGIASGFANLCRTSGNVLGVAFCTALVTWTMGNAGYPPSLSEVRESAGAGLFEAFALGMRSVAQALILLAVPVLLFVTTWSIVRMRKGRQRRSHSPD